MKQEWQQEECMCKVVCTGKRAREWTMGRWGDVTKNETHHIRVHVRTNKNHVQKTRKIIHKQRAGAYKNTVLQFNHENENIKNIENKRTPSSFAKNNEHE